MEKDEKDIGIDYALIRTYPIPIGELPKVGELPKIGRLPDGGFVIMEALQPDFQISANNPFTVRNGQVASKLNPEAGFVKVDYDAIHSLAITGLTGSPIVPNIGTLREGLDRSEIDQVANMAGLTKKEIAVLLGRSERNRYYTTSKRLSLLESEHLVDLRRLFAQGQILFDGDTKAFSDWLRTPKQALAVPETGFSVELPEDYKEPSIDELFAPHTEQENKVAIEKNMDYNRRKSVEQNKPFPTPLSILDSPTGLRLVSAILGRIEAGVFS